VLTITRAETETQLQQVRALVAEYMAWDASELQRIGLDAREVFEFYFSPDKEALPGKYAPPGGCLLLASWSGEPAGCVAFQRLTPQASELKRLFVRPQFRGKHVGQHLVAALIAMAQDAGYGLMRLETVTFMEEAIALYTRFGFRRCPPYYAALESFSNISVFMELDLAGGASNASDPSDARRASPRQ
jgi:GNAT superfamily N-acetyltransferase